MGRSPESPKRQSAAREQAPRGAVGKQSSGSSSQAASRAARSSPSTAAAVPGSAAASVSFKITRAPARASSALSPSASAKRRGNSPRGGRETGQRTTSSGSVRKRSSGPAWTGRPARPAFRDGDRETNMGADAARQRYSSRCVPRASRRSSSAPSSVRAESPRAQKAGWAS